jgi:hypothetical protein
LAEKCEGNGIFRMDGKDVFDVTTEAFLDGCFDYAPVCDEDEL